MTACIVWADESGVGVLFGVLVVAADVGAASGNAESLMPAVLPGDHGDEAHPDSAMPRKIAAVCQQALSIV